MNVYIFVCIHTQTHTQIALLYFTTNIKVQRKRQSFRGVERSLRKTEEESKALPAMRWGRGGGRTPWHEVLLSLLTDFTFYLKGDGKSMPGGCKELY